MCVYVYIIRRVKNHPPPDFLTGVEILWFLGSGFQILVTPVLRFFGCRFLISEMPISEFLMPHFFYRRKRHIIILKSLTQVSLRHNSLSYANVFFSLCLTIFSLFSVALPECRAFAMLTHYNNYRVCLVLTPGRVLKQNNHN